MISGSDSSMMFFRRHQIPIFTVACALACSGLVATYLLHERYIYFWDYVVFWNFFRDVVALLPADSHQVIIQTMRSINDWSYNYLPILPLAPFGVAWGDSRMVYLLGIVNVIVIPTALLAGLALTSLIPETKEQVKSHILAVSVIFFLILHPVWIPVLEGRPDIIGLTAIFGLLSLYLKRPLAEQPLATLIFIGTLLAFAFLARRWYLYWVIAFFPAALVGEWLRSHTPSEYKYELRLLRNLSIIALASAVTLTLIAGPMLVRIFVTNYSDAYSAYKMSGGIIEAALLAVKYFGVPLTIAALLGISILAVRKSTRPAAVFLVLQSLFIVFLFYRVQDFGAHHLYLLLPFIFIGSGTLLLMPLRQDSLSAFRRHLIVPVFVFVCISSSVVFSATVHHWVRDDLKWLFPQATRFPKIRNDFEELQTLLDQLDARYRDNPGSVYVIGSSIVFNDDILRNLCRAEKPTFLACSEILRASHVDKRDGFPGGLSSSRFIIVATPAQYHLRPEDQRTVGLLTRDFENRAGVARAFEPTGRPVALDQGVSVQIFERIGIMSQESLEALSEELIGAYPQHADLFSIQR